MASSRPLSPVPEPEGEWPWLDPELLIAARSARVCLTCHWFRHHSAPQSIPQLACGKHHGLLAQGEHLTHRCAGWTDRLERPGDGTLDAA